MKGCEPGVRRGREEKVGEGRNGLRMREIACVQKMQIDKS
jgi:hypothetical protein